MYFAGLFVDLSVPSLKYLTLNIRLCGVRSIACFHFKNRWISEQVPWGGD